MCFKTFLLSMLIPFVHSTEEAPKVILGAHKFLTASIKSPEPDVENIFLLVHLLDLTVCKSIAKCNTSIRLYDGDQLFDRTETIRGSLNPEFKKNLKVNFKMLQSQQVTLKVFNEDLENNTNRLQYLGSMHLSKAQLLIRDGRSEYNLFIPREDNYHILLKITRSFHYTFLLLLPNVSHSANRYQYYDYKVDYYLKKGRLGKYGKGHKGEPDKDISFAYKIATEEYVPGQNQIITIEVAGLRRKKQPVYLDTFNVELDNLIKLS